MKLVVPCLVSAGVASVITYMLAARKCPGQMLVGKDSDSKSKRNASESDDIYESAASVAQYLEFHFTPSSKLFEPYDPNMRVRDAFDFTVRVAQKFSDFPPAKRGRVLDLGCAVGMSSFELSRIFDEVVGIDLSSGFIAAANKLKHDRKVSYNGPEQGRRELKREFALPADVDTSKIRFEVGDALNIDPALGTFDGLLAANLVCRVGEPEKMLRSFAKIVNVGGIVVLVSPYSWWTGASSPDKWIGGKPGDERSEVLVRRVMESAGFEFVDERNEPFLIRDHHRRFQLGFSSATVWRRRA